LPDGICAGKATQWATPERCRNPALRGCGARSGGHDSRATLATLYAGRADYQAKVAAAAAAAPVRSGYLLSLDAQNVFDAQAATISPALIPKP
jgi:hypothetical protein